MNHTFAQLAQQAGITVNAESEKFAELIVRECAKVSEPVLDEPYEDMTEFGKGLIEGQDVAIEKIKQHFGVEE